MPWFPFEIASLSAHAANNWGHCFGRLWLWGTFTTGEILFSIPYSLLPGYCDVNSICHLLLPSWLLILTLPWHPQSDGLQYGIEVSVSTGTLAHISSLKR